MLRRVVKDHSDIKKSLMMRTVISVWHLKENTIVRVQVVMRGVFIGMRRCFRMSHRPCRDLKVRIDPLQIDRIFLSF
ncbi:hypothetical protein BDI4_120008 [Burkholderia diffusa]|nr:hypothetical protein BDI4_120008 [Burkholderia diffusa]